MQIVSYKQILEEVSRSKFIIIDNRLLSLYPGLKASLAQKSVYYVDRAESSKNLSIYSEIVNFFLDESITRNDLLYVIGGGATSDLGGFVAATILRGIDWIVIPTTLLAMIDASIGGKVGINCEKGKNLIGNFHLPIDTLICHHFLSTLDELDIKSGRGELLKYCFLSKDIKELVLNNELNDKIIAACGSFKEEIAKIDFFETGERKKLNLGHSFGHAFEKSLDLSHGVAVAYGLQLIIEIYTPELKLEFTEICKKLDINLAPQNCDFKVFDTYFRKDKKRRNEDEMELIIPNLNNGVDIIRKSISEIIADVKKNERYSYYFEGN